MNMKYEQLLKSLEAYGVDIIDTSIALHSFPFTHDGAYLYRDGTHLTVEGSRFVGSYIRLLNE